MNSSISCAHCGTAFDPARPTEQFCSGACRMAAHQAFHPTPPPLERAKAIVESSLAEGNLSTRAWLGGLMRTMSNEAGLQRSKTKDMGLTYIDVSVVRLDQLITELNPLRS